MKLLLNRNINAFVRSLFSYCFVPFDIRTPKMKEKRLKRTDCMSVRMIRSNIEDQPINGLLSHSFMSHKYF